MTHSTKDNNGTIAITTQVQMPMQGTFIGEAADGTLVVEKGIVRPPLQREDNGKIEDVSAVREAAFKRWIADGPNGEFYALREVGKEKCRLALQTILFSVRTPADMLDWDTARIMNMTALDLLCPEARKKVTAGVPISLLVQDMAPWDMLRRIEVYGIRATVYGSTLVQRGDAEDELTSAITRAFEAAGFEQMLEWSESWFMALPGTAESLARQLQVDVDELIGRWFLVHRDPALPDGTSLFPARFGGVVDWATSCRDRFGVVLHPADPNWSNAGGDFDGDSATIYTPSKELLPRGSVPRLSYLINGRTYNSDVIAEQIIEAAADVTTQLLGPIILNSMRLAERELDYPDLRTLAASGAQGSVQAKKHAVDSEAVADVSRLLAQMTREASENGEVPFIADFLNAMKSSRGLEAKVASWKKLMDHVNAGTWDNGSSIERAMVRRIRAIDVLFSDIQYFQGVKQTQMPQSLKAAAIAVTPLVVADAMTALNADYSAVLSNLSVLADVDDEEVYDSFKGVVMDKLRTIRAQFFRAAATGRLPTGTFDVVDVQNAMIGYGPARLAAQYCPSETFMALGKRSKRIITSLIGHNWINGTVNVSELKPIPNCVNDVKAFSQDLKTCELEVISKAKNSLRVCLSSN